MKVLSEKNKIFRDVKKRYDEFTADEHARAAARARKMFLLDQNTREYEAREEGLAEGRKKNAIETAAKLKDMGLEAEKISEATGLTEAEIDKL